MERKIKAIATAKANKQTVFNLVKIIVNAQVVQRV